MLEFVPRKPRTRAQLRGLRVHVRDHRGRALAPGDRSLEALYEGFVLSQRRASSSEARRLALAVRYGADARPASVGRHEARIYPRGPEPAPGDIDGRQPAVVTWAENDMHYLLASSELDTPALMRIAESLCK